MNAPYEVTNAMANLICGMPPSYQQANQVINAYRKRMASTDIYTPVTFMGLDLYVGIDCYGDVASVAADSDGTDVTEIFREWSTEILAEINKQQGEAA